MPLSSLSTVNTAMNNLYDLGKTAPMPLDAIEERRASNQAERLAEYEAKTNRITANEYGSAGQATRATQAATALVLKTIGPPPKDDRSAEYAQWLRNSAGILISSGDEAAIKLGNEMLSRVEAASNTGRLDPDTQKGAQAAAGIAANYAQAHRDTTQAGLNASLITKPEQGASKEALQWAASVITQVDPGKETGAWYNPTQWAMFKRNYTPEQLTQKSYELATIYDQVRRQYSARMGGQQMPFDQAKAEAWRLFMGQEGSAGGSPVGNTNDPMGLF